MVIVYWTDKLYDFEISLIHNFLETNRPIQKIWKVGESRMQKSFVWAFWFAWRIGLHFPNLARFLLREGKCEGNMKECLLDLET